MGVLNKLELIILNLSEYCLGKIQNMADLKNSENMTIKKGDIIAYTPDDKFNIQCKYLGNCEFEVLRNSKAIIPKIKVDDMTLLVKSVIEEYNHDQKNKKTVANIFSQGHLNGNTSFINIQQKQKLSRIIDDEQNIIWEYKTYNTKNKKAGNQTDSFYNIIASSKTTDKNHYNLKLALIQNCIYGCDIQNIAIQITKLRFFISLICEQEKTDGAENFGINPLPNLETKIVCANSLIGLNVKENGLFHTEEIDKLENELLKIRSSHVIPKTVKQKYELRKEDRKLAKQLASLIKEMCDIGNEKAKQLADYNPYDQNAQNDFFDVGWMFGITDGFDIVIGNPPYGAKVSDAEKKYYKQHYATAQTKNGVKGSTDTFVVFIERGHDLLKIGGNLAFIVPMSVTSSDAMCALHNKIESDCSEIRVSSYAVRPKPVFENAVVNTSIFVFVKDNIKCEKIYSTKMHRRTENFDLQYLVDNLQFTQVQDLCLQGRIPKIGTDIERSILQKVLRQTKISEYKSENGKPVYYRAAGGRYFKVVTNYSTSSSAEKFITVENKMQNVIGCVLSSSLSFWFYQIFSDNLNWKSAEIESFTIPKFNQNQIAELESLYSEYLEDIEKNANIRTSSGKSSYNVSSFKEYKIVKSKSIIDRIDDLICPLYGLTAEETEFIKNYELEARMSGVE